MRTGTLAGFLAGACLLVSALPARSAEIGWAKSFQAAEQQARSSQKLVMVDFYTDW